MTIYLLSRKEIPIVSLSYVTTMKQAKKIANIRYKKTKKKTYISIVNKPKKINIHKLRGVHN